MTTYVDEIEPRLTPHRPARPERTGQALVEWATDLTEELACRLARIPEPALYWRPHPDANDCAVTAWHVARWLDVLGTRAFSGAPHTQDCWHLQGWVAQTGYEPDGVGWLGLGTLTGYSPSEMRAVPRLSAAELSTYLTQAAQALVRTLCHMDDTRLHRGPGTTVYQGVSGTLQGSFGHLGEIDALVSLNARLRS